MTENATRRPLAVIDIDGVVADVRHRLHFLQHRPKDWDGFFAAAPEDPPLDVGLERVQELAVDHDIVFLTGRPERCRRDTETWLAEHGFEGLRVIMRANHDRRPARWTKHDELERLARGRLVAVIVDDDPDVVEELAGAGWPVELATWVPHSRTLHQAQEKFGRT